MKILDCMLSLSLLATSLFYWVKSALGFFHGGQLEHLVILTAVLGFFLRDTVRSLKAKS